MNFETPKEDVESYKWTSAIEDSVSELIPYGLNFLDRIYQIHEIRETYFTKSTQVYLGFHPLSNSVPDLQGIQKGVKVTEKEKRNSFSEYEKKPVQATPSRKLGVVNNSFQLDEQ